VRGSYDDGTLTVSDRGVDLVRYRAVTAAGEPHVDRLALPADAGAPAGRNLVLAGAHDHPWHLGLFFAPNYVDGVDCWGGRPTEDSDRAWGRAVDRGHDFTVDGDPGHDLSDHGGRGHDLSDHGGRGHDRVTIEQTAEWRTDDELLLDDERTVTVDTSPDRGYLLVWDQSVTAPEPRTIEGTDLSAGRGSYGGFNIRFQREMADGEVRLPREDDPGPDGRDVDDSGGDDPDADDPEDRTGPTGAYCDYTGRLDGRKGPRGSPWRAGATVFLDPETAAGQRWFVARGYPFVGPNLAWGDPLELDAGETARWRWGVWVRSGRPDRAEIERVQELFRSHGRGAGR